MKVPQSPIRRDGELQSVNRDIKHLTLMDRLKCKYDDIDSLEEVVDVERDLERYQRDSLRKIRPQ